MAPIEGAWICLRAVTRQRLCALRNFEIWNETVRYVFCRWIQSDPGFEVLSFHEIDDAGVEVRKVHVFRDGRVEFAPDPSATPESLCGIYAVELSGYPIPDIDEINLDPQFDAIEGDKQTFDFFWRWAQAGQDTGNTAYLAKPCWRLAARDRYLGRAHPVFVRSDI